MDTEEVGLALGVTQGPGENPEEFRLRILALIGAPPKHTLAYYAWRAKGIAGLGIGVDACTGPGNTDFTLILIPAWWRKLDPRRRWRESITTKLRDEIEPELREQELLGRPAFMLIRWANRNI
jgi:hypothetical protein